MDWFLLLTFIVSIIILLILMVISIYSSYLIIKYEKFQTATNFLFLNLFLSDLVNGFLSSPIRTYFNFFGGYTYLNCYFVICITRMCMYVSIFTLIAISLERYFKIIYFRAYLKYSIYITSVWFYVGLWLVAGILAFIMDVKWELFNLIGITASVPFCFFSTIVRIYQGVMVALFFQIGCISVLAYVQISLMVKLKRKLKASEMEQNMRNQVTYVGYLENRHKRFLVERRIVITALLVCFSYIIFVCPIVFMDLISMVDTLLNRTQTIIIPDHWIKTGIFLAILYPGVESLLFLCLNKPFRSAFIDYFRRTSVRIVSQVQTPTVA